MGGIETPPYSPDLNPCDYDGIARIKRPNKEKRFNKEVDFVSAYDAVIDDINEYNAAIGISRLQERWRTVIQQNGEYII